MNKKLTKGYIYLIGETDNPNHYKIGFTRSTDIEKRKKKLQTGNSNELFIKYTFFSNNVTKLEKMLHSHYRNYHTINEWFEISDNETNNFIEICEKYKKIIDALKDNPFF